MRELLYAAADAAVRHLEGLDERRVMPRAADVDRLDAALGGPLPDAGLDAHVIIEQLEQLGEPACVASGGGRFFGFVMGGALPASLAASWLATAWDQNAYRSSTSPAAALFEVHAIRWLIELLGLPTDAGGAFVTGASMANFAGLCAARRQVLLAADWDADAQGLFGAPPVQIVVSEESHPTVRKALGLLGFGQATLEAAPTDAQGRVDVARLPTLRAPAILCLQAGNLNSGASDPFPELCARAREAGAWVHVDGAFGLWARAAPERAAQVAGVELADSWATDAHKWLNTPYDCGVVLVRHPTVLADSMRVTAPYLIRRDPPEPGDLTPEVSRRARGIEVWAALRSLGRDGVADLIEGCCQHASAFAAGLEAMGLRVLNDVVLNQVVVETPGIDEAQRISQALAEGGVCWAGVTRWRERPALRISVVSWRTTSRDVERSLAAIRDALDP
jgi:glutamate/tyrosine decarboxylase-like PLP-dependent enzyme